jgi:hypothetical protein
LRVGLRLAPGPADDTGMLGVVDVTVLVAVVSISV